MTDIGIASVAAIVALCYLVGLIVKCSCMADPYIPVICGVTGLMLGIAGFYLGIPDFPASDPMTAAAVGTVSGLAATGGHQAVHQLRK